MKLLAPLRTLALPLLFCLGGLVLAHHEMILSGFRFTQNDLGDTRFNHYLLEHSYRWLFRWPHHLEFWNPPFFWPARNVAAYSDVLLAAAPFYAVWRLLGVVPDTAFQLWICTVSTLNFFTAYLLFYRIVPADRLAACFGAALFAFGATRINQTMHFQLFPHFWSIACLYALVRLFCASREDPRRRWIWMAALCAVAQLWSGFYLGWFLGLALAAALLISLAFASARRGLGEMVRSCYLTFFGAAVVSAALLVPLARHFLAASAEVGMRSFSETLTMIPTPLAWIHLGPFSWMYGWMAQLAPFREIVMEHEHRVGFGLLTTVLALVGLWQGRRMPVVRLFSLVGLSLLLMATSFGEFTAWKWVFDFFPGARAIRAVARIGIFLLIPVALGLATLIAQMRKRGRAWRAAAVTTGLVCLLEQGQTTPAFDKKQNRDDIAAITREIHQDCAAFVYSPAQGYRANWKYQLDAMWASLASGVPTLNGYAGNHHPRGWLLADTNLQSPEDEARVSAAIDSWSRRKQLDVSKVCWVKTGRW